MEKPVLKKRRGISPIWILPIVALMIGSWLLYKSYQDAGIDIVVHFASAEGITIGKTKVFYKGIPIGVVRDIKVDPSINSVSLHIEMDRVTAKGLVEDTKFWVVRPEVSAGRVHGLDTLLSGSYIGVQRGVSKTLCREFIGLAESPPVPPDAPGLRIKLTTENLGSIQRDTQIYYKNIPIGSVQRYELNENGQGVVIDVHIEPKYTHLIKTKTRFWNSSGINFKGGLSGFKFRMESLAALVYGGISLYTPGYQSLSPTAENGRTYPLYKDFDDAEFGLKMTLQLPSAQGIKADTTQVLHRGFSAGVVTDITFDEEKQIVTAHINIDPRAESILREGTRFWIVKPEISVARVRHLDTLLKGVYIAYEPGDGNYKDYFVAQKAPLIDEILQDGKSFTLVSENSKSFAIAAPILYRNLQVGEITGFDLKADGLKIQGEILIYQKYCHLVQTNSIFWKSGGLKINAGLDGVKIESGTMAALLAGGISFTNPGKKSKKAWAPKAHSFTVYESYQAAKEKVPALQARGLSVQIKAADAKDFSVGSPVLYKHIEVGEITGFALEKGGENVLIDVFINKKYAHLVKSTSLFHNISGITVEGGLSGIELKTGSLKSIIAGGIAFFTPDPGKPASARQQYILYSSRKTAQEIDKKLITI
ncbi:MAG: MlaD family protein, partial [Pseudomonadota bacterium]|nr:MlaD family protein [Pseudomonadota bacterium]